MSDTSSRIPTGPVDPLFVERWSPRAFSDEPIPRETLLQLFEAARWAPSAMNEQPWRFLYADTPETLALFRPLLAEGNQVWARDAPVLVFVVGARRFVYKDRPNRTYQFDAGAAWMSLTLQARMLGLYTHGMGGIRFDAAYEALGVPEDDYEIIAAIALGKIGDPARLPDDVRAREHPSGRKELSEIAIEGTFS